MRRTIVHPPRWIVTPLLVFGIGVSIGWLAGG